MAPLTATQMQHIQALLQQREAVLRTQIDSEAGQLEEQPYAQLAGAVADRGDAASATEIVDMDHALISLQLAELSDIDTARQRLHDGHYGICLDCGEDIDYARLQAYPVAKRCLVCQTRHEHARGGIYPTL